MWDTPEPLDLDDIPTEVMRRPSVPDTDRSVETVPGFVLEETQPDLRVDEPVHTVRDPEVSRRISYIESLIELELRNEDEAVQSSEPPTPRVRVA